MKKFLAILFPVLLVVGGVGIYVWNAIYGDDNNQPEYNTTAELLIKQDKAYFDNMAGNIMFFESQAILDTAFCAQDKFAAVEITNVFEQILTEGDSTVYNVYKFHHPINYTETNVEILKNVSPWSEDVVINPDSVKICFDQAFQRAKQSDLTPSKSRFMTLRNPLGPQLCNPQYIIGSTDTSMGVMFIDGVTGNVTDKDPAFPQK